MANDFLSFYKFFQYFLKLNKIQLTLRPFHKEVCQTLQNVCLGLTKEKIVIINISPRVGKCVVDSEMILTQHGYKKAIEVNLNDELGSYKNGKLVFKKIKAKERFSENLCRVKLKSGKHLDVPFHEPFLTQRGWVEAKDLTISDALVRLCSPLDLPTFKEVNEDELAFISLMIFDGGCSSKGTRFTNENEEIQNLFESSVKKLGMDTTRVPCELNNDFYIKGGHSRKDIKILSKYGIHGKLSKDKELPIQFFNMPIEQKYKFLSIMFATDGYYLSGRGAFGISLASEKLIDGISLLLDMVGIPSTKHYKLSKCDGKTFDCWYLHINPNFAKKLYPHLNFYHKKDQFSEVLNYKNASSFIFGYPKIVTKGLTKKMQDARPRMKILGKGSVVSEEKFTRLLEMNPDLKSYQLDNFIWDHVSSVSDLEKSLPVNHFEIDSKDYDDQNYIANGIVVHNTKLMEALACWTYAYFSDSHIINASYADDLATASTRAVLETLKSEWFQSLFGDVTGTIQQADHFKTKYGGVMKGAGLSGKLTGFGAGLKRPSHSGLIICDDLAKPAEAHSQASLKYTQQWFTQVMTSRRNSPNTPIIICAQRISEEDICGYVLSKFPNDVIHLKYPAMVDGKSTIEDTISTQDLLTLERVDPFTFYSQYQQEPRSLGGNIIKSEWFKYYDDENLEFEYTFMTADTAQKTKEHNDFSVIGLWGVIEKKLYLIDIVRGKFEAHVLEKVFIEFYLKHMPRLIYIEDKSSGTGLIQTLRNKGFPIQDVQRTKDKLTRVLDMIPFLAVGVCYLKKDAEYLSNFINEVEGFRPDLTHKHDDQVDVLADAIDITFCKDVSIFDCL